MNRRTLLKGMAISGLALVAPTLILPRPRTILQSGSTLFVPPVGGWLPANSTTVTNGPALFGNFALEQPRTRTITLRGTFPPGMVATAAYTNSMPVDLRDANLLGDVVITPNTVLFRNVPVFSEDLQITLSSGSVEQRVYTFSANWAGDYERNIGDLHLIGKPFSDYVRPTAYIEQVGNRLIIAPA